MMIIIIVMLYIGFGIPSSAFDMLLPFLLLVIAIAGVGGLGGFVLDEINADKIEVVVDSYNAATKQLDFIVKKSTAQSSGHLLLILSPTVTLSPQKGDRVTLTPAPTGWSILKIVVPKPDNSRPN